jgi:hypothetical protein
VLDELDLAAWWQGLAIRDLRGRLGHLADQNPGITEQG